MSESKITTYRMTPIDPLISRDARPFGTGGRVRSLDWLSQSVVAGAIRTALWKEDTGRTSEELKKVAIRGPFPIIEGRSLVKDRMYLPRPLDIVVSKEGKIPMVWQITPKEMEPDERCNMPFNKGLWPAEPDTEEDFKPEKMDAFWSVDLMARWLQDGKEGVAANAKGKITLIEDKDKKESETPKHTLAVPQKDERTHVKLDPDAGTAEEGMLFSTIGLDFVQEITEGKDNEKRRRFHSGQVALTVDFAETKMTLSNFTAPVGGERRLARFEEQEKDGSLWACPKGLTLGKNIRMVLATPAVFENGWLPGWIDKDSLEGELKINEKVSLKLKLVSAVTGRWQPLSGWNYEDDKPKALRRAVPAGSVYFFRTENAINNLEDIWLRSVCDDTQDQRDGLGLALWGNWKER